MYNGTIVNLFTIEGGISILESIGIADFILIIFIGFLTLIAILNLISDNGEAIIGIAIFGAIVYFTTLYFYKIASGIYIAETIEKNGKIIGKGIEKNYNFDIVNDDYIKIINNKDKKHSSWNSIKEVKFIYNKNKSNYIIKTYEEKYTKATITVSLTGTVYWHEPKGKIFLKTKVHN
jgi:hypothetical protein